MQDNIKGGSHVGLISHVVVGVVLSLENASYLADEGSPLQVGERVC